ncbi:MAG: class I SAM-dependent RNA methyltransferase, partial [Deltaproteobacteria bacterium]|nr:class I SAM-dependent RNA methyltransferase [Deltaproteobacteria bacterium]
QLLLEALERIGHIRNPHLLAPLAAQNPFHYRSKIRLQVSRQGEVGFFKAHSKHVIPIQHCLIADERLNQSIPEAAQIAQKLLKEDRASRHEIELRIDEKNQVRLSSETSSFDLGEEASFIQVNAAQNEHLVETALQALNLSGSEKVLELFAGEGNFTFPLSKQAGHVTAVELSETAVLRAEARKQKEHVRTVEFIQSSAYRYLEETRKRNPKKFDLILLDPPRKGAFECMASIAQVRAKTIVYVSCDPSTLARDLRVLTDLGYRHESSQIIDMFPQTYHIESVTKLTLDEL